MKYPRKCGQPTGTLIPKPLEIQRHQSNTSRPMSSGWQFPTTALSRSMAARSSSATGKTGSNRPRTMILDVLEFIRRFLQHVLPSGFMKVRYFGVFSPSFRLDLDNIRARIELAFGFAAKIVQMEMISLPAMTCPSCGHTLTYLYSLLPHRPMAMEGGPPG